MKIPWRLLQMIPETMQNEYNHLVNDVEWFSKRMKDYRESFLVYAIKLLNQITYKKLKNL